jgi:carboxyl-terminal processing protease
MDESGILNIIEPFENSPAKKVGLRQGDKIIKVDGKDVTAIRDENMIISMIKGKEDTKVKITVFRPSANKPLDFVIIRKRIKIINIKSEVLPDNIGYIKITMFDGEIAKYFAVELSKLMEKKVKGLVIDLRDNPGGAYEEVVRIADILLPQALIVYTKDKEGKGDVQKSDKAEVKVPLTILINGNSASASEILAGAIKDNKRGTLVGTKSFGKGLVQTVLPLEDGSGIKVTIARYYTPSNVCIQGIGIEPNEVVNVLDKYKNMPISQIPRADDVQLQAAVQVLKAKIQK